MFYIWKYTFDEAGDSQILGRGGVNLITEGKSSKVFIVFPELLKLCEHKNLRWDDNNLGTWLIIPKEKATSYIVLENAIIYYKLQGYDFPEGWYTWFHNVPEESCSVIEKLELFTRDGTPKESKIKIKQVSKKLSGTLTGSRYFFNDLTDTKNSKVVKKILEIIKEIES